VLVATAANIAGGATPASGWIASIAASPNPQVFGRPVSITIDITDVSATNQFLFDGDTPCGYLISVVDLANGRKLPDKHGLCDFFGGGIYVHPGNAWRIHVPLSHYVDLPHPGAYAISLEGIRTSKQFNVGLAVVPIRSAAFTEVIHPIS